MTSSLVGSEMCIRDSLKQDIQLEVLAMQDTRPPTARWEAMRSTLHKVTPVSYTHLMLPTICSV
eukprot:12810311-Prorocentrum_lima.AAC.1